MSTPTSFTVDAGTPIPPELAAEALHRPCDPGTLGFALTDELPDLEDVIGQPRAFQALELGSELASPGYNIFVMGYPGSGRTTLSQEYLARKAAGEPTPDDWCYVQNFDKPYMPRAIRLPAGKGSELQKELHQLILRCSQEIPRLLESEEYANEREKLINELKKAQEMELSILQDLVERNNFIILRTPVGFVLVPAVNKTPLSQSEIEHLTPEQQAKLEKIKQKLDLEAQRVVTRLKELEKETTEKLEKLKNQLIEFYLSPLIDSLKQKYLELETVLSHLDAIQADIIENSDIFHPERQDGHPARTGGLTADRWMQRYSVNLLVDNSDRHGAPVIVESHPSYQNLQGRIEHEYYMGASRTDFTMIRPGALHQANGGYLLLPVRDLLLNPYAYEGLKRVIRDRSIRMIELGSQMGLLSTVTLEPEAIPLEIKIILIGTPLYFHLLNAYDEDFPKLFKVRAEFASTMRRDPGAEKEYSLFVRSVIDENHLPTFDCTAVARIIEFGSRLAEDQFKLSTWFGKIADLVCEAAYWCKKEGQPVVTGGAVQRAIAEAKYRKNLYEERLQELITEGTLLIDVGGKTCGQVNALSVLSLGDYAFGRPSRVTASAYPGKAGVIDIERQAKLGGPVHTKGVLILSAVLGNRYCLEGALNLTASLTFEQSYDEIEGDSASAAELLALLSAIAETPLRQDRAITGSINQHGQIQAIGGVNEKVEGFFAICEAKRLTGEQGVLIPEANQRHLMLDEAVVSAVRLGQFHIWPIRTLEQALALLLDEAPGERQADGTYPPGSFNDKVLSRLEKFAKLVNPDDTPGDHQGDHK